MQAREFNAAPFVGGTYLGVNLAEIDANRAKELKLKEDYGVEITRVEENSPAEKAGLKAGDVVLEYNGQRVEGMEQFGRMVRETPPGREVKLTDQPQRRDANADGGAGQPQIRTSRGTFLLALRCLNFTCPISRRSSPRYAARCWAWRPNRWGRSWRCISA